MNTFYVLEPRWFFLDRYFKVYVTDRSLCGVVLAKQVNDQDSANRQMVRPAQFLAPLMQIWADRLMQRQKMKEAEYDRADLESDRFLRMDKDNFRILRTDVLSVVADLKKRLWTPNAQTAGTIRLRLRDQSRRQWIITGNQDLDVILGWIGIEARTVHAGERVQAPVAMR